MWKVDYLTGGLSSVCGIVLKNVLASSAKRNDKMSGVSHLL